MLAEGVIMLELYQFPFSHYCEKARWSLDYKGQSYRVVNLLPGFHASVTRKIAPGSCVPIIRNGKEVVQDSAAIIDWLDARVPERLLTPAEATLAEAAREWERWAGKELGDTLRLWFYHYTLAERDKALGFLLTDASWFKKPLFRMAFSKVGPLMRRFMRIDDASAAEALGRLQHGLDRLDAAVSARPYLAGDAFSRADLSAAALLSPMLARGKSAAEVAAMFPAPVLRWREEAVQRPSLQWVARLYQQHR